MNKALFTCMVSACRLTMTYSGTTNLGWRCSDQQEFVRNMWLWALPALHYTIRRRIFVFFMCNCWTLIKKLSRKMLYLAACSCRTSNLYSLTTTHKLPGRKVLLWLSQNMEPKELQRSVHNFQLRMQLTLLRILQLKIFQLISIHFLCSQLLVLFLVTKATIITWFHSQLMKS